MKAIRVLRFIFLGIGALLIVLGIVVLVTMKPGGQAGTVIFSAMGIALLGTLLISLGVGGLVVSLVMFIKYGKFKKLSTNKEVK